MWGIITTICPGTDILFEIGQNMNQNWAYGLCYTLLSEPFSKTHSLARTLFVFVYLKYIFLTQQLFKGGGDVSNRCRGENRKNLISCPIYLSANFPHFEIIKGNVTDEVEQLNSAFIS
jgi:hypothetical protein